MGIFGMNKDRRGVHSYITKDLNGLCLFSAIFVHYDVVISHANNIWFILFLTNNILEFFLDLYGEFQCLQVASKQTLVMENI